MVLRCSVLTRHLGRRFGVLKRGFKALRQMSLKGARCSKELHCALWPLLSLCHPLSSSQLESPSHSKNLQIWLRGKNTSRAGSEDQKRNSMFTTQLKSTPFCGFSSDAVGTTGHVLVFLATSLPLGLSMVSQSCPPQNTHRNFF